MDNEKKWVLGLAEFFECCVSNGWLAFMQNYDLLEKIVYDYFTNAKQGYISESSLHNLASVISAEISDNGLIPSDKVFYHLLEYATFYED